MLLLLDQGIPVDAAALLRGVGYECRHVSEFGMQAAEDEAILTLAAEMRAIVVTLDADFHSLVAVRRLHSPSVIRLRREGCKAQDVVQLLTDVLRRYPSQLDAGCLISIKTHRMTYHRLPVGSEE